MKREQVEKAIKEHPKAVAVLVNNPTYYGICSDLRAIVKMAHDAGMLCLADEAHGTHFYFGGGIPVSAMAAGSDMAAVSMHKSEGSLTQSSVLLTGPDVHAGYVRQIINLTQTTSGSYLLMSSLDISRRNLAQRGRQIFHQVADMAEYAREEINAIGGYYAFGKELVNGDSVFDFDITKLSVHTLDIGLAGIEVYDILRDEYDIQIEFGDIGNILAYLSIGDRAQEVEWLVSALAEIRRRFQTDSSGLLSQEYIDPQVVTSPQDAFYADKCSLPLRETEGKVCSEFVMCYPPGIPILAPGDDPEWRAIYEKRCKEEGFSAYFDYSWQWAYRKKFEDAGLTALLGCGFDPGVTQAYCAYALKHEFDQIDTIDILDCNGGDHGYAFATNFNPEINLREVSAPGSYWENGHWVEIPPMDIKREYNFDQVGDKDMYLLHHEEIESLAKTIPGVKRIRFFMTFGQSYLDHMRCLEDVGMLSTTPIQYNGQEIVPIQFLKALLPDPASLGPRTKGKTNIGCIFTGVKDGKEKTYYIYNVCDHQECYHEVGSQAISYTTGVPAMCGALMMLTGKWIRPGVYTVEEFDPDPFLDALDRYGLPRSESHDPKLVD